MSRIRHWATRPPSRVLVFRVPGRLWLTIWELVRCGESFFLYRCAQRRAPRHVLGELPRRRSAYCSFHMARHYDQRKESQEQGAYSHHWTAGNQASRTPKADGQSNRRADLLESCAPCNLPGQHRATLIVPALSVCGVCSKSEKEHGPDAKHKYERNTALPPWHGWHAFRRGLATNLHRLGVPDTTIQKILRHSNVAVTQACYIKTTSEESKAAMRKLESALTDTNVTPKQLTQSTKAVM